MYIVAIAWIYVVLLMAMTEPNAVAGVLTFAFYGLLPLALLLWLVGTPIRRRRLRQDAQAIDQPVGGGNGKDAQSD